jgi:hypothetical protein
MLAFAATRINLERIFGRGKKAMTKRAKIWCVSAVSLLIVLLQSALCYGLSQHPLFGWNAIAAGVCMNVPIIFLALALIALILGSSQKPT